MHRSLYISIIFCLSLSSCALKPEKDNVENVIKQGLWKISVFIDSSVDETADFEGYQFNFHINHYLVATRSDHTITGNWKAVDDNGAIKLKLHFTSDNDHLEFTEIEEEWEVIELTSTLVKTSADGGEKFLDFKQI